MQVRKKIRLLSALLVFGFALFCGSLQAQADENDPDFVKYEDLSDEYRQLLETAPEVVYEQEGNDPPTPWEGDGPDPVKEIMSWKLSSAKSLSGSWVLGKLELTDEKVPAGVKAKSKEEVLAEVAGDFPVGKTGFSLSPNGKFLMQVGDQNYAGNAGIHEDMLVFENPNVECSTCGNRLVLRILSQSANQLSLGIPLQDADEPYLINLHFKKSTN